MKNGPGATRAIFFIGFMGAGKTTVGAAVAKELGWGFIDLDDVITGAALRTVAEIFRDEGEAGFRERETEALRHVLDRKLCLRPTVVALGGGAFVQPQNFHLIRNAKHPTVFLDAEIQELRNRCATQAGRRPLYQDENQFRQLYDARRSAYMEADLRVDTAGKAVDEIVKEVISRLDLTDDFIE